MAVIKAVVTPLTEDVHMPGSRSFVATWSSMANGDTGEPVVLPTLGDRSVQVQGTFGSGGNCRLEGTNDGSNYHACNDYQGNALNMSVAGLKPVAEATYKMRPNITAGDGDTLLTVTLVARR